MRIAMVSEHASPLARPGTVDSGGQGVHVAELSAALARRGNEVAVYTRREDPDVPERIRVDAGYEVVHVPAGPPRTVPKDEILPHMTDFARYLRQDWEVRAPDIAHAHFWMSGIATQLAARALGTPTVQTFHALGTVKRRFQGAADTSPEDRIRTERVVAKAASRIIATSSDEAFELGRMGTPRARISVVPSGVDLSLFTPDTEPSDGARDRSNQPSSAVKRIVSAGRLVPRKGFDIAIRAVAALPDVELVIAGGPAHGLLSEDHEAQRLKALADDLGVADRVHLVGHVPREYMPSLLRSADVVLCTPWYEPFGMVTLEAMACGVPVVAHAVGGILDTIVDGVTGMLVPPDRPRLLINGLREILGHPSVAEGWGIAGRDRAVARYSWEQVAQETERAYARSIPVPKGALSRSSAH
ncbi:glycosyltransferase [Hoyosella altamirensis]|uniref:Glycosyltransferase involved in cell wall biosynthesis n=1 Tax=Hoyosella altamirensis TaxID=616997 RepID=A0A839RQH9_9ACTN|nr:glycosyltransferase [Hoyosella altamirensis]MBB3038790.1 glycosyltransferase involved in cell wall biosynthesis [Hoyosella altamirensis]